MEIFTVPFIVIGEYQNSKPKQRPTPTPTLGQKKPNEKKPQKPNNNNNHRSNNDPSKVWPEKYIESCLEKIQVVS